MAFGEWITSILTAPEYEIIRRYSITNAFDSTIATLAIVFAHYVIGTIDTSAIVLTGTGAGVAMCISGISSVYLMELAEKGQELKVKERAMARKLSGTSIDQRAKRMMYQTSMSAGISPLIASILVLTPFMFMSNDFSAAYLQAFSVSIIILIILGIMMSRIAHASWVKYAILTLSAGLITSFLIFLLNSAM